MKLKFLYLVITICAFGVGTFFAISFYTYKTEKEAVLENGAVCIPSKLKLQTETQAVKTPNLINFDDLKINGIGLDLSNKDLIKKFGEPKKTRNDGDSWNCLDSDTKTLFYRGLVVVVTEDEESKKYKINDIDISSSRFELDSGIKIGDDINYVFSKFGKPYHQTREKDIDEYHFAVVNKNDVSNDGGVATFSFRNNKLVKIHWHYNFC